MRLFIDDPSEPDDGSEVGPEFDPREPLMPPSKLPRSAEVEQAEAASEINERACVICGKPSPEGPECAECDLRETRRWRY